MDCKSLVGKANHSEVGGGNHLHPVTRWSEDLIESWCLFNQNGQSTTKVDSMRLCFLMKKVFALQCHGAEPNGWPWKWIFNLWWWRGFLWGCLSPLRGGKFEAGKHGNKYFPSKKLKCLRLTSYTKDLFSSFWEGKVESLVWVSDLL